MEQAPSTNVGISELSRLSGVSRPTIYRYLKDGRLPGKQVALTKRWKIPLDEALSLLLEMRNAV